VSGLFSLQVPTRDKAMPAHLVCSSSNTYTTNLVKAGGDDEFQGCTTLTFVKPDGSGELGEQCQFNASRFATKLGPDPFPLRSSRGMASERALGVSEATELPLRPLSHAHLLY
jgi:hypothetical protein